MLPVEVRKKLLERCIPAHTSFELTYLCNQRCIMCYQLDHQKQDGELSTEKIKDILKQLAEAGCLFLSFTGGEPLLRKDFWQIAEHAVNLSFAITLQTNGTLLSPEIIKKIKELNFYEVHISLLGATAPTHDRITGYPGSFSKALQATRLLKEMRVTVIFKTTLLKENVAELQEFKKLAEPIATFAVRSAVVFPMDNGAKDPLTHRISNDDIRLLPGTDDTPADYKPDKVAFDNLLCGAGRNDCCINPKGLVYPCVGLPMVCGDLKKESFMDIWTKSERLNWLRSLRLKDLKNCYSCSLINLCGYCIGMNYLEEGDILSASREICRIARIINNKEVIDNEKEKL